MIQEDLAAPPPAALARLGPMPAELILGPAHRGLTFEAQAELVGATTAPSIETRREDGSVGAIYDLSAGYRVSRRSLRGNRTGSTVREADIVAAIDAHHPGDRVSFASIAIKLQAANERGQSRDTVARWFKADPTRWARLVGR